MAKLAFTLIFVFLSSFSFADENQCLQKQTTDSNQEQLAQQGCCSHHGGECGCSGGRDVCCDGSYSPSCGCHANDVKDFMNSNEPEQPKS